MIHHVGAGGGYNERDGVEYVDRDESDEEFDEVSNLVHVVTIYQGVQSSQGARVPPLPQVVY